MSLPPQPPETQRLRALCDLLVADVRENAGLHRYDGQIQDLSADGVRRGLAALGCGPAPADPHDAAHLEIFEAATRWYFAEHQGHRRDPLLHLAALDLACYDREYAPAAERAAARRQHLAGWPEAVQVAITTLDGVPAPVAEALLPAARGLAAAVVPGPDLPEPLATAALAAHARLVDHLAALAADGDPDCAVGARALAQAMSLPEGIEVDLTALAERAAGERKRLTELLVEACRQVDRSRPTAEVVAALLRDHPDEAGVLAEAQAVTREVLDFTREHRLAPWTDGECLVGPAPASRRWALAMMNWAAPEEPDAPSRYYVTGPDPAWPEQDIADWLAVFSRTTLPAITIHEVAPGHFAHARSLRRAASPVRRQLIGATFVEGWAHYVEEAVIEHGFRAGDPRYLIGMCLEALIRVTRLTCSIGLHTGELTVAEAAELFERHAYQGGSAAWAEARRGTFDIGYGRYTVGKLAIQDLRRRAEEAWGGGFTAERFHSAMLELGAPPIGLLDTALRRP